MKTKSRKKKGFITQFFNLIRSGSSTRRYYESMNHALHMLRDEYTMLHYPLYVSKKDDFLQAQANLTRYCMSQVEPLAGKSILEIGCGNGVQAKYIAEHYQPGYITGIDLNRSNIRIANQEKSRRGIRKAFFLVDDAQQMRKIKDQSFDVVINIESAFHYPDKQAFLNEVYRVLAPGGKFLIADILTRNREKNRRKKWKKKMILHHWSMKQYLDGIRSARLELHATDDITKGVISGFKNFRLWIRQMKRRNLLTTLAFKIFYYINVRLNVILLKKSRQYVIFSGYRRPVPSRRS